MLPLPTSSSRRPNRYFPSATSPSSVTSPRSTISRTLNHLRGRTRLTNLAVTLLFSSLAISLLLNISYYLTLSSSTTSTSTKWRSSSSSSTTTTKLNQNRWIELYKNKLGIGWLDHTSQTDLETNIPISITNTLTRNPSIEKLNHLIMVPGHAIWLGSPNSEESVKRIEEDDEWILEPMQRRKSVKTFIKHVKEGVERAERDQESLLVFSGGATRPPPSPPTSEAQSYLTLATALGLVTQIAIPTYSVGSTEPLPINARITTEEFALDSYENLLFSIARFREVTGTWPEKITVVGYGMKRKRFEQLHARAIGWPLSRFEYVGIDDEGDTTEHYAGELKYGFTPFLSSPSGCHPPLSIKRQLRNPFSKFHPYHTSNPDLIQLFEWCPRAPAREVEDADGMEVFNGHVPWRDGVSGHSYSDKEGESVGKGGVWWDRERD